MLRTAVCDLLGIEYPIVQPGMAREYTNAELVAAVSAAGGLGTLGCLGRPADEAVTEIRRVRALTDRPFSVNFVLHHLDPETFEACLAERVPIFTFFRGDPATAEPVARARAAGAVTLYQATTTAEAERAVAAGIDGLIAQGYEAGGHNGPMPLLALLPQVIAVAGGRPVLAAGGLVDGRSLAAVIALGAAGMVMGTRFLLTAEAPITPLHRQQLLAAGPDATVASGVPDLLWGTDWPGVTARALRNRLLERWIGHEDELAGTLDEARARLEQARVAGDPAELIFLAGMGVGQITEVRPAGEIVRAVVAEAVALLRDLAHRSA